MVTEVAPTILVNGLALEGSYVPRPVRITHGRSSPDTQPDAPTLEFTYLGENAPCMVGDMIRVVTGLRAAWGDQNATWEDPDWTWNGSSLATPAYDRFYGTVTDVKASEDLGAITSWDVQATGIQATLGFVHLRKEYDRQTDIERVNAIAADAGVTINIAGTESLELAPDSIDRDALGAIQEICKSTGGLFWQARDGSFWYGTSNHRDKPTEQVLPAGAIIDGIEWENDTSQILNKITVVYPAPLLPPIPSTGIWSWDPSQDTGADPGSGDLRLNAATAVGSTTMAISAFTDNGIDVSNALNKVGPGTRLFMQLKSDSSQWIRYEVIDQAADMGDYYQISIDFKDSADEIGNVTNNKPLLLTFDTRHQELTNSQVFTDDASIAEWGLRQTEIETIVADENAASLLALTILARRAQPYWRMPGVLVPYADLTTSTHSTMQNFEVSMGILVPIESSPAGTPAPVRAWAVEGWVEEWREDGYMAQLALTDWKRSSSASTRDWQGASGALDWTAAATKTYRDMLVEVT